MKFYGLLFGRKKAYRPQQKGLNSKDLSAFSEFSAVPRGHVMWEALTSAVKILVSAKKEAMRRVKLSRSGFPVAQLYDAKFNFGEG